MKLAPTNCPRCQSPSWKPWEVGDHYYVCGAWWDAARDRILASESICGLVNMTRERNILCEKLITLKKFVSSDDIAITYQIGQYRTEILNILNKQA